METRKVSVTLDKAREWYNSGNAALKEVALQAFTEKELRTPDYRSITTINLVYKALCKDRESVHSTVKNLFHNKHLMAIYDVDDICRALNGDWKPSLVSGSVYYPWVKFYKECDVPSNRRKDITNCFMYNGEKYALVGGGYLAFGYGLGSYSGGGGYCSVDAGLFGCKSREIALHMSTHFAKEIFLACYADKLNGEIEWLPY